MKFEASVSKASADLSIPIQFEKTDFDNVEAVYFKARFGDKSHFSNFADRGYFASDSHTLRFFELIVFEGDNIQKEIGSFFSFHIGTKAVLSSGEEMVLAYATIPGPYNRLRTDSGLASYARMLELGNLRVAMDISQMESSNVANCLHSIDPGKCLVCRYRFVPESDHAACGECSWKEIFDNPLSKCVAKGLMDITKFAAIKNLEMQFDNLDPLGLDEFRNYKSKVHTYTSNSKKPPGKSDVNQSTLVDLGDSRVYWVWFNLVFNYKSLQNLNDPFFHLNFHSGASGKTEFVQFDCDEATINTSSKTLTKEVVFTIFSDQNSPNFDKLTFLLSERATPDLSIKKFDFSQKLFIKSMSQAEYQAHVLNSHLTDDAKLHPVTLPLDLLGRKAVYSALGLFGYEAVDPQSLVPPPIGVYVESVGNFSFLQACSRKCLKCESSYACTECEAGYFLRHRACFKCSSDCLTCKDTKENCTGSQPKPSTGDLKLDPANPANPANPSISDPLKEPPTCESNEYLNAASKKCLECSANCAKCSSPAICSQCNSFYIIKQGRCVEMDPCAHPQKLSANAKHHSCTTCPSNCLFCNQISLECYVCNFGYYSTGVQCEQCPLNCEFCLNSQVCLRCARSFDLTNGACVDKPVSVGSNVPNTNFQQAPEIISSLQDLERHSEQSSLPNCQEEIIRLNRQCLYCETGYFLDFKLECQPCPQNCLRCLSADYCLKCRTGFALAFEKSPKRLHCQTQKVSLYAANQR